jgi:hypothetical protein
MRIPSGLALAGLVLLAGCGSIIKGSTHEIAFTSTPTQASISIVDEDGSQVFNGKTPATVTLNKKRGYFSGKTYYVTVDKPGFKRFETTLNTRVSAWYVGGNILFGGLIGWLIVDPLTGGMWTISPEEVDATMAGMTGQNDDGTLSIVLLENIPPHMRDGLIALN